MKPIPCYLLTGILGAGKTTLVNHILRHAGDRRFAVIVNELGAIDVDGELIETSQGPQLSLANGCLCCTIRDDLEESVLGLLKRSSNFDGLIVEASGVADPTPILNTFLLSESLRSRIRIDSVIAVIDVEGFPLLRGSNAYLARRQAAAADLCLLNKSDLVDADQVASVRDSLSHWIPRLRVLTTTQATVPLELLLGRQRFNEDQLPHGQPVEVHVHSPHQSCNGRHNDGQLLLESWCFQADGEFEPHALASTLKRLPIGVYRAKGMVRLQGEEENQPFAVQLSGTRLDVRPASASRSQGPEFSNRIVFLAEQGAIDIDGLTSSLHKALETPEELTSSEILLKRVKRILG